MFLLSPLLVLSCALIAYQDFKSRMVVWSLFPLLGLILGLIHIMESSLGQFLLFSAINILMVTAILLILRLIVKLLFNKKFINTSIGLGDILFFYALALGFPTVTFLWLFVCAIVFSTVTYFIFLKSKKTKTVPLAGLMGLFLMGAHIVSLLPFSPSLYLI